MDKYKIQQIEKALRLHINYKGVPSNGKYLKIMNKLTCNYLGAPAIALSNMLDDYFNTVNVKNLNEALDRLRKIDNNQ